MYNLEELYCCVDDKFLVSIFIAMAFVVLGV